MTELRASNIFSTTTQSELVAEILGYYSINDGGSGQLYYDSVSTLADNGGSVIKPNSIGVGSPGRWIGIFENDIYNLKRFGAKADYGSGNTNNSPIIQTVIDSLTQGSVITLFIPAGKYYCLNTINVVDKPIHLEGEGTEAYSVGVSKLMFPVSKVGISWTRTITYGYQKGAIKNLVIEAEAKNPLDVFPFLYNGIEISSVTTVSHVRVIGFSGNGIQITSAVGLGTDASLSYFEKVVSSNNNGSGFYIGGPDVNQISFIGCDVRDNSRYGFEDASFLGNQYFGCSGHANTLGHFYCVGLNAYSTYVGCYGEGDGSAASTITSPYSTVVGGIHANGLSNAPYWAGFKMYNKGLNFIKNDPGSGQDIGIGLHEGQMDFYGPGGEAFYLKNKSAYPGTYFSMEAGINAPGESQLWEMLGIGQILRIPYEAQIPFPSNLPPRYLRHATHAFRQIYLNGKFVGFTFDNLQTQLNNGYYSTVNYHQGDLFFNARYDGSNPIGWMCYSNGSVGVYSEGLTATNPSGGTILTLNAITSALHEGQSILVNGIASMIMDFSNGDKTKPIMDKDMGIFSTPKSISYVAPLFKPFSDSSATIDLTYFGDGSDGDAIITSATQTAGTWLASGLLSRDAYLNNLSINSLGSLDLNGYRLFVLNTLDIAAANSNSIHSNANNGANASSATGASAVSASTSKTIGVGTQGGAGGSGGTAAGAQAVSISAPSPSNGGRSGSGGAAGSGSSGAGGVARVSLAPTNSLKLKRLTLDLIRGATLLVGGGGAPGGAGGGGDGTAGGGGGSGGNGGNVGLVSARTINRSASTAVGAISMLGGNGGSGFSSSAGNRGGGAGAGGGWLVIIYKFLTGVNGNNVIRCNGGKGGNGGNGFGTGVGGAGGNGGYGGRITLINTGANTIVELDNTLTAGTNGSSAAGNTGGGGGNGTLTQSNL